MTNPAELAQKLLDDAHMTQRDGLTAMLDTAHQAAALITEQARRIAVAREA